VRAKPEPVLKKAIKVLWIAATHKFDMDAAKPSTRQESNTFPSHIVTWDDHFVDELKRGLYACRVL
jgi:POT family proton-dependent oligopeptide transporter